jgi:hypothetical protein
MPPRTTRQMRSVGHAASVKSRVFGCTAPLPGDPPTRIAPSELTKYSTEREFLSGITSRFSLNDPKEYLRTSSPAILIAHLNRELGSVHSRISEIEKSDSYAIYTELKLRREVLANELLRVERVNSELRNSSQKICDKFARYVTEIDSPKSILGLRDAQFSEEEFHRKVALLGSQRDSLRQRMRRELLSDMNESLVPVIERETARMIESRKGISIRATEKRRSDDRHLFKLHEQKVAVYNKLVRFFNYDDQDIVIPMSEVLVYVKTKDTIIDAPNFEKQQRRRKVHEFWEQVKAEVIPLKVPDAYFIIPQDSPEEP